MQISKLFDILDVFVSVLYKNMNNNSILGVFI
jgi:hypothetical protein